MAPARMPPPAMHAPPPTMHAPIRLTSGWRTHPTTTILLTLVTLQHRLYFIMVVKPSMKITYQLAHER